MKYHKSFLFICCLSLAGCATNGTNGGQTFGGIAGAIGDFAEAIVGKNSQDKDLPDDVKQAQKEDRGKGILVGTAAGAVVGNVLGDNKESTAIGAAMGAAAGGMLGDKMATDRGNYARNLHDVTSSIAQQDQRIFQLRGEIRQISTQIQKRNQVIAALQQEIRQGHISVSKKQSLLAMIQKDLVKVSGRKQELTSSIQVVDEDLALLRKENLQSKTNEKSKAIQTLSKQRNDMLIALESLNGVKQQLEVQQNTMERV